MMNKLLPAAIPLSPGRIIYIRSRKPDTLAPDVIMFSLYHPQINDNQDQLNNKARDRLYMNPPPDSYQEPGCKEPDPYDKKWHQSTCSAYKRSSAISRKCLLISKIY